MSDQNDFKKKKIEEMFPTKSPEMVDKTIISL